MYVDSKIGICLRTLVVALLCIAAGACGPSDEFVAPEGEQVRYELTGRVVEVDREDRRLTVAHDAIPGFMEPMTMPFRVRDEWVLSAAAPGDTIRAELVVVGTKSWLERVSVNKADARPVDPDATHAVSGAAPGTALPSVELTNQTGRKVDLGALRGQYTLVTFIFTRCPLPDYCPLMTQNFAEIDRQLRTDPSLYRRTRLASITLDPEYDTPEVLAAYASPFLSPTGEIAPERWDFLTGRPEAVREIATFFGLVYRSEEGQIVHSLRTAIVDPEGKVVKVFRGNEWRPDDVVADVKSLASR